MPPRQLGVMQLGRGVASLSVQTLLDFLNRNLPQMLGQGSVPMLRLATASAAKARGEREGETVSTEHAEGAAAWRGLLGALAEAQLGEAEARQLTAHANVGTAAQLLAMALSSDAAAGLRGAGLKLGARNRILRWAKLRSRKEL